MAGETADALMKRVIENAEVRDKLIVTYYNKITKATDPIIALKLYHIENYILTSRRFTIFEDVPFVKVMKE